MIHDDGYFDASVAVRYDADHNAADPAEAVRVLAKLAGAAPALEFAIGTGRVALPLHAKGVEMHGIELSKRWSIRCAPSRAPSTSPSPSVI